jgi:hypothetical protein
MSESNCPPLPKGLTQEWKVELNDNPPICWASDDIFEHAMDFVYDHEGLPRDKYGEQDTDCQREWAFALMKEGGYEYGTNPAGRTWLYALGSLGLAGAGIAGIVFGMRTMRRVEQA